eukprot:112288-Pelagomonas_calceolata.AAC.1
MLVSNSETPRQVLKADLHLADRDESCWSAHVSKSYSGMHNEEVFKQKLLIASKIPMQEFLGDLRYRQHKFWREADALSPREHTHPSVSHRIDKDLDKGVMRSVGRFRLRAHCLKVES